jgi:hypothetical protein
MKTFLHRARSASPLAIALMICTAGCSGEDPGDVGDSSSDGPQGSSNGAGAGSGSGGSAAGAGKRVIGYFPA